MDPFYKLVAKILGLFVATVLFCRFTWGYGLVVIPFVVLYFSITTKTGALIMTSMFLPLLVMVNPVLMPRTAVFAQIAKFTSIFVQLVLIFTGASRTGGNRQLPLGGLTPYLFVALISSTVGYFPLISYLKIANFTLFFLSVYIGTRNMDFEPCDMRVVRAGLLAFAIFLVYGSLLTLPFPSIAYYTSLRSVVHEYGAAYADYMYSGAATGEKLFTGVLLHSQALGPTLASIGAWTLCDMLFIENKVSKFHLLLLSPLPALLFMTRARIALLTLIVSIVVVFFYCFPRMRLSTIAKTRILTVLSFIVFILFIACVSAELKGAYMTKWLRKTDDVKQDDRTMSEAVTNSRQAAINMCMRDFRRNRLLGKGFQTIEEHRQLFKEGKITWMSASVEKGLLPLMILGETGVLGAITFVLFLFVFFTGCTRRSYFVSGAMFIVLLATNMAEATFFSPSGVGGYMWMQCLVGGFAIDLSLLHVGGARGMKHV